MRKTLAKAGVLLFVVTGVSKVAAFVVTIVFSYYFGTDAVTDAYYAAGTIPNLVNNSLTICALTLFVPVYSKCKAEEGSEAASRFTSNILNSFVVFNIGLLIAVCITAPILAKLVAPGFADEGLKHTEAMIRLLSMSFPFTVAAVTLNSLFNANQKYLLPAILTLFNHVFIIVLNIVVAPAFGIYSYPFICTGAWIVQLAILYANARGKLFKHDFHVEAHDTYFTYMLKQAVPVMVTTAADQINLAADNVISSDLPSGSLSCLGYAHRIYNSVNGLVSATLLTIYYPIISRQYAEHDREGLNRSLRVYIDMMVLITLSLSAVLVGSSYDVIDLLLHHGAMRAEDIWCISLLFIIYMAGLFFLSLKEFATRLFYIIGNTKTPTIINVICVVINIAMSLIFKQFWGVYGVALATTIATTICASVECAVLLKGAGGFQSLKQRQIINASHILKTVVTCAVSAVAMLIGRVALNTVHPALSTIGCIAIFVLVFLALSILLKNEYVMKLYARG